MKLKFNNISENFYLIAFFLITFTNVILVGSTISYVFGFEKGVVLSACEYVSLFLLIFRSIWMEKYTPKEIIIIGMLLIISIGTVIFSGGSRLFLFSIVFMITSKNINFDKLVKIALLANILGVVVTVSLALFGIIDMNTLARLYVDGEEIFRLSLGFSQPNYLGAHIFIICLCILYLNFNKMKSSLVMLVILFDLLIYYTCYSRTNFYLIIILLLLCWLIKVTKLTTLDGYKKVTNLFRIIPFLIAILSILLCVFYEDTSLSWLNEILSNRLVYGYEYYNVYGFSIFGQFVDFSEILSRSYTIDNAYLYLGIRFGVVPLLLLIFLYSKMCKAAIMKNKMNLLAIVLIIAIWAVSETYYFRVQYNFTLIFLSCFIFEKNYLELFKRSTN